MYKCHKEAVSKVKKDPIVCALLAAKERTEIDPVGAKNSVQLIAAS